MSRRLRRLRPVLGVLFALGVLWVAEVGLRLAGVAPAYQADAIGGWRLLPEMKAKRTSTREGHSFIVTTNADGLRTTLPRARTPGVPRVAVMGDSTVFGWGVDDGGTVADGLARGLGDGTEVLNGGQPGYSTAQVAAFFEDVVRHYRPDAVVVFLPMHDHNLVLVSDAEVLDGPAGPLAAVRVGLAKHSRIYQALRSRLFPLTAQPFVMPGQGDAEPRVPRVSPVERAAALLRMRARLGETGGVLAIGHLPFVGDLEAGRPVPRTGAEEAAAWATREGVPLVDVRACGGPGEGNLVLPDDPGHLGREGNLRAGEASAGPMRAMLAGR